MAGGACTVDLPLQLRPAVAVTRIEEGNFTVVLCFCQFADLKLLSVFLELLLIRVLKTTQLFLAGTPGNTQRQGNQDNPL